MPQKPGQQPATGLGLMGTASFHGVVQGSTRTPHLTGQLTAQNLAIKGSTLKSLRTNVDVSPSFASLAKRGYRAGHARPNHAEREYRLVAMVVHEHEPYSVEA